MSWTSTVFATAIEALSRRSKEESTPLRTVARSIWRSPIKLVAAFIFAPFLAFRVARAAKNRTRRLIAGAGLFLAILLAWLAGTLLGTAAGALLIASQVGIIWGLAFFVGTAVSVTLSVAFSILVLNATSLLFLQLSSEEVVEYLRTSSE